VAVQKIPYEHSLQALAALRGLKKALQRLKPRAVHTHLLKANFLGGRAAHGLHLPVVESKHNDEPILTRKFLIHFLHRWNSRQARKIICISKWVRHFYETKAGLPGPLLTTVYYGLSTIRPPADGQGFRKTLGIPPDAYVVSTAGRLVPQKDQKTLVRAVQQSKHHLHLILAGTGPLEQELRQQGAALGPRFHMMGWTRDMGSLLEASDLFVLPSIWEGLGLVLLEAMRMERAVVASNISAIPEIVEDGVTGILLPPGEPARWTETLDALLDAPEKIRAMGQAGRKRLLEHFPLDRMVERTHEVYQEVLASRPVVSPVEP